RRVRVGRRRLDVAGHVGGAGVEAVGALDVVAAGHRDAVGEGVVDARAEADDVAQDERVGQPARGLDVEIDLPEAGAARVGGGVGDIDRAVVVVGRRGGERGRRVEVDLDRVAVAVGVAGVVVDRAADRVAALAGDRHAVRAAPGDRRRGAVDGAGRGGGDADRVGGYEDRVRELDGVVP